MSDQKEKKSNYNALKLTASSNSGNFKILHHDSSSAFTNSNSSIQLLPKLERNLSEFDLIDYDEDVLQDDGWLYFFINELLHIQN